MDEDHTFEVICARRGGLFIELRKDTAVSHSILAAHLSAALDSLFVRSRW